MTAEALGERLADVYRRIHATAMRDAPICNEALSVEPIGFRPFGDHVVGVVVTPWFANLVAVPIASRRATLRLGLPAGDVDFSVSELEGFGLLASCSLFSPMFEFVDQDAVRATARAVLEALFDAPPAAPADEGARLDRRALFGGRRRCEQDERAAP